MEFTSLSDALISLIPIYGPWIIFGIVAFESAGVPLPGETILVAAALLARCRLIGLKRKWLGHRQTAALDAFRKSRL